MGVNQAPFTATRAQHIAGYKCFRPCPLKCARIKGYFPAFPPSMQEELAWSWVLTSWVLGVREANQGSAPRPSHAPIQHAHTRRDMEMELQPETECGGPKQTRSLGQQEQSANLRTLPRCLPGLRTAVGGGGAAGACQGLYQEGHKEDPSGSMGCEGGVCVQGCVLSG